MQFACREIQKATARSQLRRVRLRIRSRALASLISGLQAWQVVAALQGSLDREHRGDSAAGRSCARAHLRICADARMLFHTGVSVLPPLKCRYGTATESETRLPLSDDVRLARGDQRARGHRDARRHAARGASSASGRATCARGGADPDRGARAARRRAVAAVLFALRPRTPDLDATGVALAGEWDAFDPAGELALLRALASLRTTDAATMSSALGEVAAVQEAVESLAGSDAERAGEPRTCCRPPAVANHRRSCLDSHHGEVDSR